ncbi:ATP-binding protein [Ammonicoccus fulvus]|uniref:Oxygen sensor histidine kinase NreB n=1 Tax=Ammonicoccus fulvus TaxID=3138240 RepID=A0ABZ3FKM2_9ACTN
MQADRSDESAPTGLSDPIDPIEQALQAMLATSLDGVLVLDGGGRVERANGPASEILRTDPDALIGTDPLADWESVPGDDHQGELLVDAAASRTVRKRSSVLGERRLIVLRDITDAERSQRRLAAFASAASSVAYFGSLRETLDAICAETIRTVDLAAAQILLIDADTMTMQLHGAAPQAYFGPDFSDRIAAASAMGAEFSSRASLRKLRPIVTPGRRQLMLDDPRWAPLHDHLLSFEWDTFVSIPLVGREAPIGALNIYGRPGSQPTFEDIAFFTAMADQISVAVQHARLFSASKLRTQHEERQRLARELHDSACQELFSINLHVRAAKFVLAKTKPVSEAGHEAVDKLNRHVTTLGELAHAALEDMRALIFQLYPTVLQSEGLVAVTRQLLASLSAREGIAGSVESPDEEMVVDADAALEAYHIVREALHNVLKHARASRVHVRLAPDRGHPDTLSIEVIDDGVGLATDSERRGGFGLTSMRERADRMGGWVRIEAAPEGGTRVRVALPGSLARGGRQS